MSVESPQAFWSALHVGVVGIADGRRNSAPLLAPVWYSDEPDGEVLVETGRVSVKVQLPREAGRLSLCVRDESAPYRYVSVEGPVIDIVDPVPADERRKLTLRYMNADTPAAYLDGNKAQLDEDILVRMRPER